MHAFLLTREWRDGPHSGLLQMWCWTADGPLSIRITNAKAICFASREERLPDGTYERRPVALTSPLGAPVDALYFPTQRALNDFRERCNVAKVRLFESDVRAADRYLMERFIQGGLEVQGQVTQKQGYGEIVNPKLRACAITPRLKAVSLDIETDGFEGALYSIALAMDGEERVLMRSEFPVQAPGVAVECLPDERQLLLRLCTWFAEFDPDVIIGWNLIGFDLTALERRFAQHGLPFTIGRAQGRARVVQGSRGQPPLALVPGRVAIDGIESLRAAFWIFEDYALDAVARELLGRGKLIEDGEDRLAAIQQRYTNDRAALARYNIEDCRLVAEIIEHTGLIRMGVERASLTGLALGRLGGSVACLDNLYLPRLHRRGRVAYDIGSANTSSASSPGGHVLDSSPGIYDHVVLLDFKSLYPSIIRTFRIDPLGLWEPGDEPIEGFLGAQFAREGAILPDLIDALWAARDEAKKERNGPLSQAIKIIMNAFYGVLGATGCRFFDPRLASSITRRGHEVLKRSKDFIEAAGFAVIYGDTDSLFVHLSAATGDDDARRQGQRLARALNDWWQTIIAEEHNLKSALEVEFETHFTRFLMPTLRGSDQGSKKRYAGIANDGKGSTSMVFKGLESVRTDWTPLARNFQRELYRRVFAQEPFEEWVESTVAKLYAGALDHELIYRKRLRRDVDEYAANVPPQVQAARRGGQSNGWVKYVITLAGPRLVTDIDAPLDYEHYKEKQIAPVADGVLQFLDTSFARLTDRQLAIF
ncbi:MAG: DNA polymerase II [Gammaproteobacteria bacterium]|nr:DNA polymerase II [Gammaproteobacteria bacterium]